MYRDISGQKFGLLTVIARDNEQTKAKNRLMWICSCECGKQKSISADNLLRGNTKSCGCLKEKHSMSHSRLYSIWHSMKQRCNNQNSYPYPDYGGRGIRVCEEWNTDFTAFMKWAYENGYSDELTLDRIDNDKGYSPDNCRWTTMLVQRNNTRANKLLTINGRTMNASQWAKELGISRYTIYSRIRKGWSDEDVLLKKNRRKRI